MLTLDHSCLGPRGARASQLPVCVHTSPGGACESADSLLVVPEAAGLDPGQSLRWGVARTHVLGPSWLPQSGGWGWESGQVLMLPCRLSSPVY